MLVLELRLEDLVDAITKIPGFHEDGSIDLTPPSSEVILDLGLISFWSIWDCMPWTPSNGWQWPFGPSRAERERRRREEEERKRREEEENRRLEEEARWESMSLWEYFISIFYEFENWSHRVMKHYVVGWHYIYAEPKKGSNEIKFYYVFWFMLIFGLYVFFTMLQILYQTKKHKEIRQIGRKTYLKQFYKTGINPDLGKAEHYGYIESGWKPGVFFKINPNISGPPVAIFSGADFYECRVDKDELESWEFEYDKYFRYFYQVSYNKPYVSPIDKKFLEEEYYASEILLRRKNKIPWPKDGLTTDRLDESAEKIMCRSFYLVDERDSKRMARVLKILKVSELSPELNYEKSWTSDGL